MHDRRTNLRVRTIAARSLLVLSSLAALPSLAIAAAAKTPEPWEGATPIDQRMTDEAASRAQRAHDAFVVGAKTDFSGRDHQLYAQLFLNQDVPAANAELRKFYQDEIDKVTHGLADRWDLRLNIRLILAYYQLGSHGTTYRGRLEPESEKLLLQLLWERTKQDNDIALAGWDVWWMTGSENHDLNFKISSLLSSRIFMDEPDYSSRVYPDIGHGAGGGYWFGHLYGTNTSEGPDGGANLKDGKSYVARDHYEAWLAHMKHYLAERGRRGFFVERASSLYMKWTMMFLYSMHDYCGDDQLKAESTDFLNLVWSDWAQEELNGIRGGAKSREKIAGGYDSMTDLARFHMGGKGQSAHIYDVELCSDYQWPKYVWELALSKSQMGAYAAVSRGIGEEQTIRPRPPGAERTMLADVESRMVNYSWCTPDYILGAKMDHPDAVYGHLTISERWQGLITASNPACSIAVCAGDHTLKGATKPTIDLMLVCQSVQDQNVLITQQKHRWSQINPDWYPAFDASDRPLEVRVGTAWSEVKEKSGWVFLHEGNTYAAVRIVAAKMVPSPPPLQGDMDVPEANPVYAVAAEEGMYKWSDDHASLMLTDKFSPIIIEAGRQADYATFDDFQKAILASSLKLRRTVVPGNFYIEYKGIAPDAKEISYNACTTDWPKVGGVPVNFQCKTFDSPFIQSDYKSGVVTIKSPIGSSVTLDFNKYDAASK